MYICVYVYVYVYLSRSRYINPLTRCSAHSTRRFVNDFARNASARFRPPYWVKGEDSAFGFFVHISPFATLTPRHWG